MIGCSFEDEFLNLSKRVVSSPEIKGRLLAALSLPLSTKLLFNKEAAGRL